MKEITALVPKDISGSKSRLAAAVFSAFFMCNCVHASPSAPSSVSPPPQQSSQARQGSQAVMGLWRRGTCMVNNNSLSYSDVFSGDKRSLTIDSVLTNVSRVLCSENFTVILANGHAVVSLGGQAVLENQEMLGYLGDRFVAANSYEIGFRELQEEGGPDHMAIRGNDLIVTTRIGREWRILLSDPYTEWSIY